jgi:hypothetical protein
MIRYSHAMTCLMAYHNKKRTEAISIVLQSIVNPFLSVDHITPKSKGGTYDVSNLQLLCLADHRQKDNALKKVKKQ